MKEKKKYLAIITFYRDIESIKITSAFNLKRLSEEFKKIYFINAEKILFFPTDYKHDFSYIKKNVPDNFILFEPKSTKEFSDFLDDKELLAINAFGRYFGSIKVHYLLKKFKIKQVQISNVGNPQLNSITSIKHPLKKITYDTSKFMQKFTLFLANIGLIGKVDIRFISNKTYLRNIKKNRIKNFLYTNKLFFAKELIAVNCMASDILKTYKQEIKEDYIVHLDGSLNYYHETQLRGHFSEEKIQQHYLYLSKFLKNLSNIFNKEIIVCIHPRYNLEEHKKNLPDFKVVQFKTREYVYKSFLVTTFDSSAVIDAVILKKK